MASDLSDLLTVEPHASREGEFVVVPYQGEDREPVGTYGSQVVAWHAACWQRFHDTNTLPHITPGNWFHAGGGQKRSGYTSDPRFANTVPAEDVTPEQRERIERAIIRFCRERTGDFSPREAFFDRDVTPETDQEWSGNDDDLPGMWSHSDFLGGDPDERSYAQRARDAVEPHVTAHREAEALDRLKTYNEADQAQGDVLLDAIAPLANADKAAESPAGDERASTPADPREALRERLTDREWNAFCNFSDLAETAPSDQGRNYWLHLAHDVTEGAMR